jgi:hypothetical protein
VRILAQESRHIFLDALVDELAPKPGKRGPYKKTLAANEISN